MSTITLKNNIVAKEQVKKTIKDRIKNYYVSNQESFYFGLCALSGRLPDFEVVRAFRTK